MAASSAALAQSDPTIIIDSGDPNPLLLSTDLSHVQPNGTTPLTFDFLNDTGAIVTSFTFQTTVNPGLSPSAAASFTPCQTGYFLDCKVFYNPADGTLVYDAFGVLPPDGDEIVPGDDEANEQEGIPVNGAFHITLVGWTADQSTSQLYSQLPAFTDSFIAAPEPSGVLLLGTALLSAGLIQKLLRRAAR